MKASNVLLSAMMAFNDYGAFRDGGSRKVPMAGHPHNTAKPEKKRKRKESEKSKKKNRRK